MALTRGVLQGTDRDSLRKLVVDAVPLRGANLWMPGVQLVGAASLNPVSGKSFPTALVELDSAAVFDSARARALASFLMLRLGTDTLPRVLVAWRPAPPPRPLPEPIRPVRRHSTKKRH